MQTMRQTQADNETFYVSEDYSLQIYESSTGDYVLTDADGSVIDSNPSLEVLAYTNDLQIQYR
jgi:hypothetical protein